MRRPSVLYKTLRDLRWQVFWYGIGLGLMSALVVYIFPSYSSQFADFEVPEAMRPFIGDADFATGKGFLSAEIFSWVPLIMVVFAIMGGTSALAGEEASGTLDLALAQPMTRTRLLLEKLAGLLVAAALIFLLIYAGWLISVPFVDIDVSLGELAVATANMLPLIAFFQAFSLWAGVTLPSRGLATGAAVGLAVVSYFVFYLGGIVDAVEPLQWATVFYHYHGTEILTDGVDWSGLGLLVALDALFTGWAVVSFQRRDLGVSAGLNLRLWPRAEPQ